MARGGQGLPQLGPDPWIRPSPPAPTNGTRAPLKSEQFCAPAATPHAAQALASASPSTGASGLGYQHLVLIASLASATLPSLAPLLGRRLRLPPKLVDTLLLGSALAAAYAGLEVLERRRPEVAAWSEPDRTTAEEGLHLLVLAPLQGMAMEQLATAIAQGARRRHPRLPNWPTELPRAARLALAVMITELGHYAHHRAAHAVPLLWRFHRTHHEVRRLSWRNATRFHPGDLMPLMLCQELPIRLLGIDRDTTLSLRLLKGVHGQLQHSNLRGTDAAGNDGWLGAWFSTTNQHRWHHARRLTEPDAPGQSLNFGAISSIWDRVFGTFSNEVYPTGHAVGPAR